MAGFPIEGVNGEITLIGVICARVGGEEVDERIPDNRTFFMPRGVPAEYGSVE